MIEFANTGMIQGKVITEPLSLRFREELRVALDAIADGDSLSAAQIAWFEGHVVRHLDIIPVKFDRRARSWAYELKYENWAAIYSHDLLVMYGARRADGRRFPGDLRRCQLASCGRFFRIGDRSRWVEASKGGRPPDRYCSPECTLKQNARGSTTRSQRSRAKQRDTK